MESLLALEKEQGGVKVLLVDWATKGTVLYAEVAGWFSEARGLPEVRTFEELVRQRENERRRW